MNRSFIILFVLLFCSCTNHAKNVIPEKAITKIQFDSDIKMIKDQFSDLVLLSAIRRTVPNSDSNVKIDYLEYRNSIMTQLNQNPNIIDSLLSEIQNDKNVKKIIHKIYNWCEAYSIIGMTYNLNNPVFLEEITYEIPLTKKIILSLLNNEQQDWGSLSESQIYELQYILSDFIAGLDEQSRIEFYVSFFEKVKQKIKSD